MGREGGGWVRHLQADSNGVCWVFGFLSAFRPESSGGTARAGLEMRVELISSDRQFNWSGKKEVERWRRV